MAGGARWVILTDDFPPLDGGVATWTRAVADELHHLGRDVLVLARARPGLGEGLPYDVRGVRGPSFGAHGGRWLGLVCMWTLQEGDRVLATTWGAATHVVSRCQQLGLRLDVVYHGSDLTRPPRRPAAFERVARGARLWTVSAYLQGVLDARGFAGDVLPAPIRDPGPPEETLHPPGPPRRWVMLGRATPLKGGDRFVRMVAAAGALGTVIGDGPELPAWRALAVELGARVEFTGRLAHDEALVAMREHDVAVLVPRADANGSGAEGFGLAAVEAAVAGLPTVGCRTGGVPEAIGPEGLLLDDPDDPAASVDQVLHWWRSNRGSSARRWALQAHGVARTVLRLSMGGV